MEKTPYGYRIGENVKIHEQSGSEGLYFLTISSLKIFNEYLCSQDCTEQEIARYVITKVAPIENEVERIVNLIHPHT